MKGQNGGMKTILMVFIKKFLFQANWPFCPEWEFFVMMQHNSGTAPRVLFYCSTFKGVKRYVKSILMIILQKFLFGANGLFWVGKWCVLINLDLLWHFIFHFQVLKGIKNNIKIMLMVFLKKFLFRETWHALTPKWGFLQILEKDLLGKVKKFDFWGGLYN